MSIINSPLHNFYKLSSAICARDELFGDNAEIGTKSLAILQDEKCTVFEKVWSDKVIEELVDVASKFLPPPLNF